MIKINNIQKSYSYPLIQLRGRVHRTIKCDKILVSTNSDTTDWPVIGYEFKFFVHLTKTSNDLIVWLQSDAKQESKLKFTLIWEPIENQRFVRLVYLVCDDGHGRLFEGGSFQAPQTEDNSIGSAINRIAFNVLCSQCFFAHTLPNRRTFTLELGDNNYPRVHIFKLSATADQIWSMSDHDLWRFVTKQLMASTLAHESCKFIAFSSFTRYSSPLSTLSKYPMPEVKGYSALGGGRLALVGTACLYTWPQHLKQLQERFHDMRSVDRNLFLDYSNNRGFLWSCYSSTLGAVVHELGHVLDLGHSDQGIMALDFHDIQLFFIAQPKGLSERKWWTTAQICFLSHHKWMNNSDDGTNDSSFVLTKTTIKSKYGIVCVEYRDPDKEKAFKSRVFTLAVKCLQLEPLSDCIAFVMDSKGNSIKVNLEDK